ncbi:DUF4344 domain-containing metallopeptidase [Sulfitobacter sp. SK012]|uniref:DUF4344 domain-containing metallopeptidase n=1 Tax=Sulfitobacter sp. SK012 TaxID=1389005 RepID=UPI0013B43243|nr:DUF4344 domain-containing metallopeptidase [Sulfitobacter sp. SK012]
MKRLALAFSMALPCGALADEVQDAFVEANLISVFYHELGHALIDVLGLPIMGQEDDAADTASILLINATFDDDRATEIAYYAAIAFEAESATDSPETAWDVHGAELQRFYNLVCLFYGADVEDREDFARDLGLPEERAETCQEEFELAIDSWGPVFDEMAEKRDGETFQFTEGQSGMATIVIEREVGALNTLMTLPETVTVSVVTCGEANAFYNPDDKAITICSEFEDHLLQIAPND